MVRGPETRAGNDRDGRPDKRAGGMMRPLAASNRGQLCTFATAALKGEACGWHQISCSKCTKKIWREKMTTTREAGVLNTCIKCSQPRRRQSATQLAIPTASNARSAPAPPSEAVLDDLGVSMETFRRLRQLQAREITAEDYDLLMRLHSKPSVKVRARPRICPSAGPLPEPKPSFRVQALKACPAERRLHNRIFANFC